MAEQKKMIGTFEVPALKGKTDEEIEAIAARLADEIADAIAGEGEEVVRREEVEEDKG